MKTHIIISAGCTECGKQYVQADAFVWDDQWNGPICENCAMEDKEYKANQESEHNNMMRIIDLADKRRNLTASTSRYTIKSS